MISVLKSASITQGIFVYNLKFGKCFPAKRDSQTLAVFPLYHRIYDVVSYIFFHKNLPYFYMF